MNGANLFECPHCAGLVEVAQNEMNCRIFRHAVLKSNGTQINPHASKEECERIIDSIRGCGKPFRISVVDGKMVAEKCDYI